MTREAWFHFSDGFAHREADLLKRCYDTIMANVYEEGTWSWAPYRCISPGKGNFPGIWNWDSAFHAIGVSRWDPALARESILGFFQFQREDGLLPDVIQEDEQVLDTYSKPPVFPWAVQIVYERDHDIDFLKYIYPKLVKNEEYWVKNRSYEGLFFYDADNPEAEDYLVRVKWESGWDNSPRWDQTITDLWPIDLNCFMVMFYRSMSYLANELQFFSDQQQWNVKEQSLVSRINKRMWDNEKQYYCDTNRFTHTVSDVMTPASFMPLYLGIATDEQAAAMGRIAETVYKEKMPTVSYDHPSYSNDYWRGPTWLNVAYFAAKGLKNYGLAVADRIRENILDMCYAEKSGIYENYDSLTGKGLYCNHFSWSCVFIIAFILNF